MKKDLLPQQMFVYSSSNTPDPLTAQQEPAELSKSQASKYSRTAIWCLFYHAQ